MRCGLSRTLTHAPPETRTAAAANRAPRTPLPVHPKLFLYHAEVDDAGSRPVSRGAVIRPCTKATASSPEGLGPYATPIARIHPLRGYPGYPAPAMLHSLGPRRLLGA